MTGTIQVADVLAHMGIGTVFACTGACTRHFCKHRLAQIGVGALLITIEATAVVAVAG